jgi:hypothetical protein
MPLFSIENEGCRSRLSVALSDKLGKTVAIKPKRHFGSWDIEVDGVVKMVSSSKFEEVEESDVAGQIFDHIKPC